MKIAFVSAHLEIGGIERVVNNLSDYFIRNNHDVHIIVTKDDTCNYDMDNRIVKHILYHDYNKKRLWRVISKLKEFRRIIKAEKFDIILSLGSYVTMYTVAASMFIDTNIIASERTDPTADPESKVLRKIRDISYRFTDGMVFQTADAKAYFCKTVQKKGTVIPNPIKEILPERWNKERNKEIVNFCRLTKQKNLPLLLNAFSIFSKTHKDYKLIIYGNGELKDYLHRLADSLGISRNFEIRDFTSDIHNCILKSAMFVSSSDYEGISNSMLESMGIGLPCICTDCPVGGARLVINDKENGILTPVGDAKALAEAMAYIAENPDEADRMGINAVKIRETLSVGKIAEKWMKKISAVTNTQFGGN